LDDHVDRYVIGRMGSDQGVLVLGGECEVWHLLFGEPHPLRQDDTEAVKKRELIDRVVPLLPRRAGGTAPAQRSAGVAGGERLQVYGS